MVVAALLTIGVLIYLQQSGFFRNRSLPQTEQQASRSGQDTAQVLKEMRQPSHINEVVFDFEVLENSGLPYLQIDQLKEILFYNFPYTTSYSVIDTPEIDSNDNFNNWLFNMETNDNKFYRVSLRFQVYDLFIIIKDGDSVIYTSPTS